jgi:hypothetical protein
MSTMITQRLRAPVHVKTTQFSSAAWT